MTANFYAFQQKIESSSGKKKRQKITGENMAERCLQMRGVYKQAKKRYRVPDTAHDCPILRIGVVHDQPVSERENL